MPLFDAPVKEHDLITAINPQPLDSSKETMALVFSRLVFSDEQKHIIGWMKDFVKEVLAPKYNLIFLGVENEGERLLDFGFSNIYVITAKDFLQFKESKLKRVKEMEDEDTVSYLYNKEQLWKEFRKSLPKTPVQHVMYLDERFLFLPLKDYFNTKTVRPEINRGNEFHDYVGDDPEVIAEIRRICKDVTEKYDYHVSLLTYTYWMKNLAFNLGRYYIDQPDFKRSYYFVVDPGSYYRVFDQVSKDHVNFALVEDKRGTRDLERFPIAELQHLYYEKNHLIDKTKKKLFIYYGTIFLSKGTRKDVWNKFLKDLRLEESDIYAPPKMDGIIHERRKEGASISRFQERQEKDGEIAELWDSVSNHPMYRGYLDTNELNPTLAQYKYAFMPKNIAINDIYNWRMCLYLSLDVFPILDYRYDPAFLAVPQEFQEKITAKSHEDIQLIISYYEAHPEEREALMNKMKEHYQIDNFREIWKDEVKKALKM